MFPHLAGSPFSAALEVATFLQSGEANAFAVTTNTGSMRLGPLVGFRFLQLNEKLTFALERRTVPPEPPAGLHVNPEGGLTADTKTVATCPVPAGFTEFVTRVAAHIPIFGCGIATVLSVLWCIVWVGILVIHVVAIIKGVNGQRFRLPVVSDFADKM